MKLIILGKNQNLTQLLSDTLKKQNFENSIVSIDTLKNALQIDKLPILIMELPVFKKLEAGFLVKLKEEHKRLSVIVLANKKDDKASEILALNAGADDYAIHPYVNETLSQDNFNILVARLRARLRSCGTNVIEILNLKIDPDEEKIFYCTKEIELKGKPFEVLTYLAKHKGQIVSKEQLLDAIWEEPELVTPNVIEVAINQIRQKMDKPLGIGTIETVRRRGYRFCFPNCSTESTMVDS